MLMRMANATANPKPKILYSPAPKANPRIAENSPSPKEEPQAEAIADAKNNRVRDRTGKQPQRTVLSTQ